MFWSRETSKTCRATAAVVQSVRSLLNTTAGLVHHSYGDCQRYQPVQSTVIKSIQKAEVKQSKWKNLLCFLGKQTFISPQPRLGHPMVRSQVFNLSGIYMLLLVLSFKAKRRPRRGQREYLWHAVKGPSGVLTFEEETAAQPTELKGGFQPSKHLKELHLWAMKHDHNQTINTVPFKRGIQCFMEMGSACKAQCVSLDHPDLLSMKQEQGHGSFKAKSRQHGSAHRFRIWLIISPCLLRCYRVKKKCLWFY